MRVLAIGSMYPPQHFGGYELLWRSSMVALRESGHETCVLTTDYVRPGAEGAEELDADVHRELLWYWKDDQWPEIVRLEAVRLERRNRAALRRRLREFQPDVVAWWPMGGMSMSLIEQVRRAGVPAVGVVLDDWMLYAPKVDRWMVHAREHPRAVDLIGRVVGVPSRIDLDRSAHWLFCSDFTLARARDLGGLSMNHATVERAGVDLATFPAAPVRPWNWRLAYMGRLDRRKGVDTAIEALRLLPEQSRLDIVGSGDEAYERALREQAKTIGVEDRVQFVPQRSRAELHGTYAAADAVLFPVIWKEPWGLVPLEAMATGRPVVATGMGGSAEYLSDEENCLLFPPGDPSALAVAVRRLTKQPELRARLRDAGLATARHYTADRYNRAIEDALVRAVQSSERTSL